jgi:hypothetical protein
VLEQKLQRGLRYAGEASNIKIDYL